MFGKRDQQQLQEQAILGDVELAEVAAVVTELAEQVAALDAQLRSQFTSVATYASIATEQVEFARNEARADLERTKGTLIELMEQLRSEVTGRPARETGALPSPDPAVAMLSRRLDGLESAVSHVLQRQDDLASMLSDLLELTNPSDDDGSIPDLALL